MLLTYMSSFVYAQSLLAQSPLAIMHACFSCFALTIILVNHAFTEVN